jgi:hypothetical protein
VLDAKDVQAAAVLLAPQERAAFAEDPAPFLRSLAQWKLFSEKAVSSGYCNCPEVKKTLDWAWKIEVAQRYLDNHLLPVVQQSANIDTAMARYACRDETGIAAAALDQQQWNSLLRRLAREQMNICYDSLVFPLRRDLQVRFLRDTWRDEKGKDPAFLLKKADSLRDAGREAEAYDEYSVLVANYGFSPHGSKALLELAAMQAEKPDFRGEAIKNYCRFLMRSRDTSLRSKAMFGLGFIYDRYLNRPDLAEMYYQWILKNAPGSALARDAGIMLQYLGEPMPGSEELREEARRQGKAQNAE